MLTSIVLLCAVCDVAVAQPSELSSCLELGSYCAESPLDTLNIFGQYCTTFVQFVGRLAFPPLVNRGPVTISVLTRASQSTTFPLYVEIRGHTGGDPMECTTLTAGNLVLVAQGLPQQCEGVWETVGPLDLTQNGIPLGTTYHIQLVGFRFSRLGSSYGSTGVSCVRVTSSASNPSAVAAAAWGGVKALYR
jgi:hypothetical protein